MTPQELDRVVSELKKLSKAISQEEPPRLSARKAKTVRDHITEAYETLRQLVDRLDPIKDIGVMFDPANPNVVGRIAGIAMVAQPRKSLISLLEDRFYGSGVYAIYYSGEFPPYAGIAGREHPIYVGKADPANPAGKTAREQGDRLWHRLNDHRRNIGKAKGTLKLDDFQCRALVVQTGWQSSAEDYLIHLFKPVWNNQIGICYGFGKHGDDPRTRANLRSPWDTLHPGREWAHRDSSMKDAKPAEQISSEIATHLAENPTFSTIDEVLRTFLDEMRAVS